MPLRRGTSRADVGANIATEENAGKPPKQAEAIALNTARTSGPSRRQKLKPFRADDHPHRDFRGEKIVNGVKM